MVEGIYAYFQRGGGGGGGDKKKSCEMTTQIEKSFFGRPALKPVLDIAAKISGWSTPQYAEGTAKLLPVGKMCAAHRVCNSASRVPSLVHLTCRKLENTTQLHSTMINEAPFQLIFNPLTTYIYDPLIALNATIKVNPIYTTDMQYNNPAPGHAS
ncbi:hypothetical protein BDZ45DRAFT_803988 [Acephala macrosclerotiorum]|nr:hypothetical protein BDZ45DRAFT_803988 [Acephala macrosclerotiorum]